MKKTALFISTILLFTACSSKSTTTPLKCQNIQNEIDNLKNENYTDNTAKVVSYVTSGRYTYGQEDKKFDQRIKVLELKLSSCGTKK